MNIVQENDRFMNQQRFIELDEGKSGIFSINSKKKTKIKCIDHKQGMQFCVNESCRQNSIFTCNKTQCRCQQQHGMCVKVNLSRVMSIIEDKIHKTDDIKRYVQQKIQKIIQQFSKLRQKLIDQIDNELKYSHLFQVQKELLQIVYQQQKNNFGYNNNMNLKNGENKQQYQTKDNQNKDNQTKNDQNKNDQTKNIINNNNKIKQIQRQKMGVFGSKQSSLLWKILISKQQIQNQIFEDTKDLLNNLQTQSKQNITKVNNLLNNLIQEQTINKQQKLIKLSTINYNNNKLSFNKQQKIIIQTLKTQSNILKDNNQLSEKFIKLFNNKSPNKISLLFKASDHQFKIKQFFDICGLTTNLVILCKSNKDKIVGGYSPYSHYRQNLVSNIWVQDINRQSFIFSLTNNDRCFLNNKNQAIHMYKDKSCIRFGNSQILIYDNSLTNINCQLYCNNSYMNQNYSYGDKQSYLSFNGNQSCQCNIVEWEAYKVQFQ